LRDQHVDSKVAGDGDAAQLRRQRGIGNSLAGKPRERAIGKGVERVCLGIVHGRIVAFTNASAWRSARAKAKPGSVSHVPTTTSRAARSLREMGKSEDSRARPEEREPPPLPLAGEGWGEGNPACRYRCRKPRQPGACRSSQSGPNANQKKARSQLPA